MRYRRSDDGARTSWEVTVDGNGYLIAAWSQWLERDLPVVAEGFVGVGAGSVARNVAVSLVARWTGWCVGEEERTAVSSTGSDRIRWFWPVIDVPDPPSRLADRLAISDGLVARWLVGDLPEEVAIEELHTAVEGLLKSLVGNGKWPQLLARAEAAGTLSSTDKSTLDVFNVAYRVHLKHQTRALADNERTKANELMHEVLAITERLLGRLRR